MKRLSTGLAVLVLGALPLTAAAFDYGSDRSLLAVEAGAPPFPDAQQHATRTDPIPRSAAVEPEADDMTPGAQSQPGPAVAVPKPTATAHSKPGAKMANDAVPARPTWQSLLPGSIQ